MMSRESDIYKSTLPGLPYVPGSRQLGPQLIKFLAGASEPLLYKDIARGLGVHPQHVKDSLHHLVYTGLVDLVKVPKPCGEQDQGSAGYREYYKASKAMTDTLEGGRQ